MELKIKANGQTLRVRTLDHYDVIPDKCLQTFGKYETPEEIKLVTNWRRSTCVGERVSQHPDRTYVEVLSRFFS